MSLGTRGSVRREAKGLFRSEGAKAARLRRRGAKVCLEVRRKSTDKESMNKGSSTDKERSPTIIIQ